jgi:biopolymer transport protein ExbD
MRRIDHPQIELQIAPLIDVCFLLLFFYILTCRPELPEGTLPSSLPGTAALEEPIEIPDEQHLTVLANGQILVNEQQFDSAESHDLPQLRNFLSRLKEAADAHHGQGHHCDHAAPGHAARQGFNPSKAAPLATPPAGAGAGGSGHGALALHKQPPVQQGHGLREDILALHLDMLDQFKAQSAATAALVAGMSRRQEELSAEVASLRGQLRELLTRRDETLWL